MATNNAINVSSTGLVHYNGTGTFSGVGTSGSSHGILVDSGTSSAPSFTTSGTPYVTGISFDSGTTTLSNYSIGTFTATIVGNSVAGTTTYSTRSAYYTRIGNLVQIQVGIGISAATGTGNIVFGGFPFTIKNQTSGSTTGPIQLQSSNTWVASTTDIVLLGISNTTTAWLSSVGNGVAFGYVQLANTTWTAFFQLVHQI